MQLKWFASFVLHRLLDACSPAPLLNTILTDGYVKAQSDSDKPFEHFISAYNEQVQAARAAAQTARGAEMQSAPRFTHYDFAKNKAQQIFILPDNLIVLQNGANAIADQSASAGKMIRGAFDENKIAHPDLSKPADTQTKIASPDGKYYATPQGIFKRAATTLVTPTPLADIGDAFYPAVIWRDNQTVWYGSGGSYCTDTLVLNCSGKWIPQPLLMLPIRTQP